MRVTGGRWRGRRLVAPKGPRIRTTLDHVRQALFNTLGNRLEEKRVLDLFAGSGALGIEALSRGAAHATFVDRSIFCVRAIEANLRSLSQAPDDSRTPGVSKAFPGSPVSQVIRADCLAAIRGLGRKGAVFDLVFLDPPYGHGVLARNCLKALIECGIVTPFGLVVAEHARRDPLPLKLKAPKGRLVFQRQKRHGDSALTFYGVRPSR